jgi:hypothetical protein
VQRIGLVPTERRVTFPKTRVKADPRSRQSHQRGRMSLSSGNVLLVPASDWYQRDSRGPRCLLACAGSRRLLDICCSSEKVNTMQSNSNVPCLEMGITPHPMLRPYLHSRSMGADSIWFVVRKMLMECCSHSLISGVCRKQTARNDNSRISKGKD